MTPRPPDSPEYIRRRAAQERRVRARFRRERATKRKRKAKVNLGSASLRKRHVSLPPSAGLFTDNGEDE